MRRCTLQCHTLLSHWSEWENEFCIDIKNLKTTEIDALENAISCAFRLILVIYGEKYGRNTGKTLHSQYLFKV